MGRTSLSSPKVSTTQQTEVQRTQQPHGRCILQLRRICTLRRKLERKFVRFYVLIIFFSFFSSLLFTLHFSSYDAYVILFKVDFEPWDGPNVTVSVTSFICLCYAASLMRSYLLFISTFDASTLYTAICPIYRCTSFISMFHSYLSPQTLTYHCCSATDRYSTYCAYTA